MMKWMRYPLIILFSAAILFGAARKIVLLEEATNASCSPCAAANPILQDFISHHFGGVISVRYHAWWPGTDPMYNQNTVDNTNRIQYYGISGVPNYMIDGKNFGVPSSVEAMTQQMNDRLADVSPLSLNVSIRADDDSVRVSVDVLADTDWSLSSAMVRVAVIERRVDYTSAPGTNGETEFSDVMRVMLPDGNGVALGNLSSGSAYHAEYSIAKAAHWIRENLAAVVFVQDDASREIINAAISVPSFILQSKDSPVDLLSLNTVTEKHYFIANDSDSDIHVSVALDGVSAPADWDVAFAGSGKNLDVTVASGDSSEFTVLITSGSVSGPVQYRLFASNLDDSLGYGYAAEYYGTVQSGDILIVDDDGGASYQSIYETALTEQELAYTVITESAMMQNPDLIKPENYRAIFWNVGWASPALTVKDVAFLENYLDNGGSLFIGGQDLGWDIFSSQGGSFSEEAQSFYKEYLSATYVRDNSGIYNYSGVDDDLIGDGISFSLNSVYSKYPDEIKPIHSAAKPVFYFEGTEKVGGVRMENGIWHTVYLGFGLEQVSEESVRNQIIQRSLAFFDSSSFVAVPGDVTMNGCADSTDAEWMLNYRMGHGEFYGRQRGNANVTGDTSISALDAALILRYAAGYIDSLPFAFNASEYPVNGTPALVGAADVAKRDTLFVDFRLNHAQNVMAMEGTIEYPYPSIIMMTYAWYDTVNSNFMIRDNSVNGRFSFAVAAGQFQNMGENNLLRLQFIVSPSTVLDTVDVTLTSLRVNEEDILLDAATLSTNVVSVTDHETLPTQFKLYPNYPNPFNPSTTIRFDLPEPDMIRVEIYNLKGEKVISLAHGELPAGTHEIIWNGHSQNGRQMPSGIYNLVVRGSTFSKTEKMVLLR